MTFKHQKSESPLVIVIYGGRDPHQQLEEKGQKHSIIATQVETL